MTIDAVDGPETSRAHLRVDGIVQGVGFRPYVHALACGLDLAGFVGNDGHGVFIEVEGDRAAVAEFLRRLPDEAPPLAVIERVGVEDVRPTGARSFEIVPSETPSTRAALVSPDVATCGDCLRELADPGDRRHGYAFTNCTNCGPRYTIVRDVPYDRPRTTMAPFPMCPECAREYDDPTDRRFHAQPTCCPSCGPQLRLVASDGSALAGDPIRRASELLGDGLVVAVKGLGGYHLAVDAGHERGAAELRSRKHREDKPFALMVPDLETALRLCEVSDVEAALLGSPAAPIVLLRRRPDARVAAAVAPGNRWLGMMLPYTPLHHLLLGHHRRPIVLTSGNRSDEPIAYRDDDARTRLAPIADAFLTHDRAIHMRVDDSVVRVLAGRPAPIRRSRGYVPRPLTLPWRFPRHVLGVGAELKNTVCVAKDRHAFVSHHIGDLENYETFRSFTEAIEHLGRLFGVSPEVVAYDLHPEYLASKHALDLEGVDLVGVQHHHAHIAACLADNNADGPVIGVAFDGTGFGVDGTIWGGELLVCDLAAFERVGAFESLPLPGGARAIREPWRMAAAYLDAAFGEDLPRDLAVVARHRERWRDVLAVAAAGLNSPLTSSAGRLFDAIAALLDVRDVVSYEGQAAIELEQRADPDERGSYDAAIVDDGLVRIRGADFVRAAVADRRQGVPVPAVAGRFHNGVVDAIVAACALVRERTGLEAVALSGGVFQNVLLTERSVERLRAAGFRVLTHSRVPANDGGISLGQVAVAAARDRRR